MRQVGKFKLLLVVGVVDLCQWGRRLGWRARAFLSLFSVTSLHFFLPEHLVQFTVHFLFSFH